MRQTWGGTRLHIRIVPDESAGASPEADMSTKSGLYEQSVLSLHGTSRKDQLVTNDRRPHALLT